MQYHFFENKKLSKIVLGTDYYGEKYSEDTCFSILDTYISYGGNVIDTARLYTDGKSEAVIGKYLHKNKCRSKIYLSTKAAHPPLNDMTHSRLSREEVRSDLEKSLLALQTDYVDILWLHRDNPTLPVEPIIDMLNELVKEGKIRSFGASNWTASRIEEANAYALQNHFFGFVASQIQWSLAKHNGMSDPTLVIMNDKEYEFYKKSNMPVFAFCSQAKGFFEKYALGTLSEKAKKRFLNQENIQTFETLAKESERTNNTISSIALSYLTDNKDFPTFAIIGPSCVSQLKSSLNIR